jgi:hypothetical protein
MSDRHGSAEQGIGGAFGTDAVSLGDRGPCPASEAAAQPTRKDNET